MFNSMRWRIAIPFAVLILLVMLGLSLYLSDQVRADRVARLQEQLAGQARLLADDVQPFLGLAGAGAEEVDPLAERWAERLGVRVTVIGADGKVLGETHTDHLAMDNHLERPEVRAALASELSASIRYSRTEGEEVMYVAAPVVSGGQNAGVVRLSLSLQEVQIQVARLRRAILAATLLAAGLAVLVALLVAERTARPVRRLTHAANRLAAGDLGARLWPDTTDEVGQLTRAFNRMGERLQEQMSALDRERSRLAGVLEHMADGAIITDEHGQVTLINPAAARLLDVPPGEALGSSLARVSRQHQLVELWQRAAESGAEQTEAVEVDRQRLFLQAVVTPLWEADRRAFLVTVHDLTRIRRLEMVRRDFVSNISHELRTPLASLRALVETLRDGAMDDAPAAQRFLDRIDGEVDAMTQMVQELLELARIESGKVPLLLRPEELAGLIVPAVERLRPQAERMGLTLTIAPLPGIEVLADTERVRQVVTNLVHNAVKFTPSGGRVTVSAEVTASEVVIAVCDTGTGIPVADQPRIFERFYKARRSRGGGTGLGLAIAKHIVQGHGGRIWVESTEGRGSTFRFSLPCAGEGGAEKTG